MVEKTEREILDKMSDEQDMLEFFSEYHKIKIDMAKMKILHTFHDLIDGIKKIYDEQTKGMTPEQIEEWQEDEEEDSNSKWNIAWDSLLGDIQKQHNYSMDIEVDEHFVTINYMIDFFYIRWDGTLSGTKPKLSEMEKGFEIELTADAHFLIDLCNKLILNSQE